MAAKKKATRKAAPKRTVKKSVRKKAAAPAKTLRAIPAKQTKSQIIASIVEDTGVARKDVVAVFNSLGEHITRHMKSRGSGEFSIPETGVKIRRVKKPRTKARMGRNPFTGEEIKIAAKPARTAIRVTALKSLKESVNG